VSTCAAGERGNSGRTNPQENVDQVEAKLMHWQKKIVDYQRKYVSMQDDGTEDDLSYIKLINYGEKVRASCHLRCTSLCSVVHAHDFAGFVYAVGHLCIHGEFIANCRLPPRR
jgi:hypothetical protein